MDCGLQILTATCVPLLPQILYKMCDTQQCDLFIVTSVYYIPIGAPSVKQNQNTPDPLSAIIISLVILYVLSSTLFCFIGSICGWVGHKHKASKSINNSQPAPLYEDVQPSFQGLAEDQKREFKTGGECCIRSSTIDKVVIIIIVKTVMTCTLL